MNNSVSSGLELNRTAQNTLKSDPKVVVIGGGTGSFMLLSSLKKFTNNITAIVNMADDGGSTGVLRDELGVLPPGDIRQCLVALSPDSSDLRDLFNYRFGEGHLSGHSFGNLFLSVLEKTSPDFGIAVKKASKILQITGQVLPVTLSDSHLSLKTTDGIQIVGEQAIAQTKWKRGYRPKLSLLPKSVLNPMAAKAIAQADLVVIAPGHLYGSLAPALLVDGLAKVLKSTKAECVYICNLVTKPGQTDGYNVGDFADEIERFVGCKFLGSVLYNTKQPSAALLKKYAKEGEKAVQRGKTNLGNRYRILEADLLSSKIHAQQKNDTLLKRTLIRHDGEKIRKILSELL